MSWVFGALAVTLGLILLWGLVAPRSQWRALEGWSVADRYRDEPGGTSYGLRRLVSGVGTLGVLAVIGVSSASAVANIPSERPASSVVAQMWGRPDPDVVNRMIVPLSGPPGGLVEMPVIGYEDVSDDLPEYFDRLDNFTLLGNADVPGYIGGLPDIGNGALDLADLVVHVRGPLLCIPRAAVVIETDAAVTIAVYYGLPDDPSGAVIDNTVSCPADAPVTGSLLIPLDLAAPLGHRIVQSLAEAPIREVKVPSE
ncbi:MAG: fumarate hydratase [Rhodoglobus sp.]